MTDELRRILSFGKLHWPRQQFFLEQRRMIESVALNEETVVVAGNKLGKDYAASFVCLVFFLAPWLFFPRSKFEGLERRREETGEPEHLVHTRKIVTTSVKEKHLVNLWGEIGRLLSTSAVPLLESRGGPLTVNAFEIRLKQEAEVKKPINYLIGQVAQQEESMAGWHAEYTLFVADEASSLWANVYQQILGCAKKRLLFGNPNPSAFFESLVRGGDVI